MAEDDIPQFDPDVARAYPDLDRELFNFATPTPFQDAPEGPPNDPFPQWPTTRESIHTWQRDAFPQVFTTREQPPWEDPLVWSVPIDSAQSVCVPWYETWTPVWQYEVPESHHLLANGISYEVPQDIANTGNVFEWRIQRGSLLLAQWEDILIQNGAPDPAHRWAFAGHLNPLPFFGRIDRTEHMTVMVKARGSRPYSKTDSDPFAGSVKVIIKGWLSRLRDAREGAPKFLTTGPNEKTDHDYKETLALAGRYLQQMEAREA